MEAPYVWFFFGGCFGAAAIIMVDQSVMWVADWLDQRGIRPKWKERNDRAES